MRASNAKFPIDFLTAYSNVTTRTSFVISQYESEAENRATHNDAFHDNQPLPAGVNHEPAWAWPVIHTGCHHETNARELC